MDARITDAQHRIEDLYHETRGKCYVSFSGGKDSTVLLALIKSCQELGTVGHIPAVFCNTGIELGITVDFVKWVNQNYYPIEQIRPEKSFDWVLENEGKPIKSKLKSELLQRWKKNKTKNLERCLVAGLTTKGKHARAAKLADKDIHMIHPDFNIRPSPYCCKILKKKPFGKYEKENDMQGVMTALMTAEEGARGTNAARRVNDGGKLCTTSTRGIIHKMPIIDWSAEDVEKYIEVFNIPLSDAYTKFGFYRTGCMACPYSLNLSSGLKYLFDHEPNRYKAAMHWLKDVYIAQNVILPFDEAYEREREHGATYTNRCGRRC